MFLALPLLLLAQATAPDPFAAGRRWLDEAPAGDPWIPRAVSLVGPGELVWSSRGGAHPGLALYAAAPVTGDPEPLFLDEELADALGRPLVAAGDRADELFALVQRPAADPMLRRTLVSRYDATAAGLAGVLAPAWTHDMGREVNAGARLACTPGGDVLLAALLDDRAGEVLLDRLDPGTGRLLLRARVPATGLRALAVSGDGSTAAVLVDRALVVVELTGGRTLASVPVRSATEALALSDDGRRAVLGDGSLLRRLRIESTGVLEGIPLTAPPGELVVLAALDGRGETVAQATWNPLRPSAARLLVHGFDELAPRLERVWPETASQLQNLPIAVRLTADGGRVAVGLWGAGGDEEEVLLLDVPTGSPLLALDLPGSVEALALDPGGTRLVVASRERHANEPSLTGRLELHGTGERDLLLLAPARAGQPLRAAVRGPGATGWVFAVGLRTEASWSVPFLAGELWIHPLAPHVLVARPADGDGRAELSLPLPAGPAWVGVALAVQAARATPAGPRLARSAAFPETL